MRCLGKSGFRSRASIAGRTVYGGLQPSEVLELKKLRDQVTKLKRLVAALSLDKVVLHDVVKTRF